jgi:dethiobiotin synthetase
LKKIAGVKDSLDAICPYRLKHPLSPFTAAKMEKVSIRFDRIARAYGRLLLNHRVLLVEGAGGLLVPNQRSLSKRMIRVLTSNMDLVLQPLTHFPFNPYFSATSLNPGSDFSIVFVSTA